MHKDLKIQEGLNRAAFQQTKRKSPLKPPKRTFKAKARSPEGGPSKVLNLIKSLPRDTQIKLFDLLEIEGKSTAYDIESKIMKQVLVTRLNLADIREMLRDLEKSHPNFVKQHEEEVAQKLKDSSPFILKLLANYYELDPHLAVHEMAEEVFEEMVQEEAVTLKRFKILVEKLLGNKYKDVPNSQQTLRLMIDEFKPGIGDMVWTHIHGTGPYDPTAVFKHYETHNGAGLGSKGLADDVAMLEHARLLNLWQKKK